MEISTIGLDLAKSVFQVHAIDEAGEIVVRKALRRSQVLPLFGKLQPCLVGMEACGTSHHWAREILKLGHEVRLMPPAYVKPYVKRGKTDANDAEAICEAVTRPTMRFVPVKSPEQQAALALHRTRDLLVKQRTQLVNMIRGLLAEFGIEMARWLHHALALAKRLTDGDAADVPELAQRVVASLARQVGTLQEQLAMRVDGLDEVQRSSGIAREANIIELCVSPTDVTGDLWINVDHVDALLDGARQCDWLLRLLRARAGGHAQEGCCDTVRPAIRKLFMPSPAPCGVNGVGTTSDPWIKIGSSAGMPAMTAKRTSARASGRGEALLVRWQLWTTTRQIGSSTSKPKSLRFAAQSECSSKTFTEAMFVHSP